MILRWLTVLTIVLAFVLFRADALVRVDGPLIADSTEYLLIAHDLLTDSVVPVSPMRNCFFSGMVAGQFALQGAFMEGPFGAASGRVLPLLFHVLAVLGAYRLGREILDARAGALAALFVAVLPSFGYWSTDCLADIPVAACIIWAIFCWITGRPIGAGLLLGIAILCRYQALLVLPAVAATGLLSRQRSNLPRCFLGLMIAPLCLGILDTLYLGEPFLSIRTHFSVYSEHMGASVASHATGAGASDSGSLVSWVQGALSRARNSAFVREGGKDLTWALVFPFGLWIVARFWNVKRHKGDFVFTVTGLVLFFLCFFVYEDLRYLASIAPLIAVVSAASAVLWIDKLASSLRGILPGEIRHIQLVGLCALAILFCRTAWTQQKQLAYRPYAATLNACESELDSDRQGSWGTIAPWILAHRYPIADTGPASWVTVSGVRLLDLWSMDAQTTAPPKVGEPLSFQERALREAEYVVLGGWSPRWEFGSYLWRDLNDRLRFESAYFDPRENRHAAFRFRVLAPSEGDHSLFEVLTEAPVADPLALFQGGIVLHEVTASIPVEAPQAVRIDVTWGIDETAEGCHVAQVRLFGAHDYGGEVDTHFVLSPLASSTPEIANPGSIIRVSRFRSYTPLNGTLTIRLGVKLLSVADPNSLLTGEEVQFVVVRKAPEIRAGGSELVLDLTPQVIPPR